MDWIRNGLIVALLVVGYLLLQAWNEDYGQPEVAAVSTDPLINQDTIPQSPELALPEAATTTGENAEGFAALATPEAEPGNVAEIDTTDLAPTDGDRIITVTTDVLDLRIDLKGGQLIYAALPDYPQALNDESPLVILSDRGQRYFVAQSALVGENGAYSDTRGGFPLYSSSASTFELAEGQPDLQVILRHSENNVTTEKVYTFRRGSYAIDLEYRINNASNEEWGGNFAAKLVRDKSADPTQAGGLGAVTFIGAVLSTPEEPYQKYSFSDMDDESVRIETSQGWVAFNQHYFVSAWVPTQAQRRILQTRESDGRYVMGFVDAQTRIAPGSTGTLGATLYVGPKIMEKMEVVHPDLALTVDYGWLWFLAKPLFLVLDFIHDYVGNWGVAIILLTVLIKLAFFRLSAASYRSMANMRRVAPEMTRLKELYGDDRQRMSQEMMNLYKKEKINPLGGCLPILVQMPVFIALYWVLLESVELRQAPFYGWIEDLSVKDPFFILPLAMGASMVIQMKLNPTPPDPIQARIMQMMPIIFTIFFLWFPAGLVLYWFVNNLLSIAQQWVITRQIEKAAEAKPS